MPTDPDDDHVVAAAVAGSANLIASGDQRDLLPLGSCQGIPIVNAREAVARLETWFSDFQDSAISSYANNLLKCKAADL
ncbi:MAG TPA: hypothetical protein VIN58_25840 [Roseateles sp.]